jgi:two-component system alkaline phosphatase synthesis response regulator PhoP
MGKHNRILAVDDDQDILDLLQYNLEKEGFRVRAVSDSSNALDAVVSFRPDLIILDIMMPHPNGIELCRQIREMDRFRDTVIFFLTARSEFYFQEAALETGGDDFIEKIMGLRALTNKVVDVLKRDFVIRKRDQEAIAGKLKVDRRRAVAVVKDREIALSKPELELLFFFAQNPGKVITSENLLSNIWGSEWLSSNKTIDSYLENITGKLGGHWIAKVGEGRYRLRPGA